MNKCNVTILLGLPLLLLSSCGGKCFAPGEKKISLPEATSISITTEDNKEYVLSDEDTKVFYETYLKDKKFVKTNDYFTPSFEFNYFYNFDNYEYGNNPLIFSMADFNYVSFTYHLGTVFIDYVCEEKVPYIEMRDFLKENLVER